MANVKITETFIRAVEHKAMETFKTRINEAETFFMDRRELAEKIVEAYIDQHGLTTEWQKIPDEWKHVGTYCEWATLNGHKFDMSAIHLGYGNGLQMPKLFESRNAHVKHVMLDEIVEKFRAYEDNLNTLRAERDSFVAKVKAFIRRHVSLKAALIEWPEFWDLVPQDYRDTYLKSPNKKARELAPLEIDLNELNGQLVTAKIVEGV